MGVDGMNSADIFDEYFDDEKPKYIIRNCDCILSSGRCNVKSLVYCQDCTDCKLKQIVELCREENYAWLAKEMLSKLDIQEVE